MAIFANIGGSVGINVGVLDESKGACVCICVYGNLFKHMFVCLCAFLCVFV
jgi:hypothetical protein